MPSLVGSEMCIRDRSTWGYHQFQMNIFRGSLRLVIKHCDIKQGWLSGKGLRFYSQNNNSNKPNANDPQPKTIDVDKLGLDLLREQNRDFGGPGGASPHRPRPLKRDTKLPLDDYKLKKSSDVYDTRKNKNPTADIFNFSEPVLNQKDYIVQVYGLSNGYFSVDDCWYPGSLILFPKQIFLWDVTSAADIRAHSFDILDVIKPYPHYIIIGTGKEYYPIEESFFVRFKQRGIRVDLVPTFEACSTFNVCNEDGINVAGFFIPANLQIHCTTHMD
eukprot:TRINITY_DN9256_c0_g1_i5.p2 TRINITY_DN9256_c0_g1~~TRINITY_DN9256_c0_g1_i5.p2  ORF type:complete len:274 (+),score=58.25 TRINITY_DN9256_c0_g1_i5:128-949(+)